MIIMTIIVALIMYQNVEDRNRAVLFLLLCYSLGLGIPFFLSAVLIQQLKSAFTWIKRHYTIINAISGALLIIVGVAMMSGMLSKLLSILSL